ncbi:MAG: prolyl oligopeptidase family serine peptidase [Bacteroidota bacterium]
MRKMTTTFRLLAIFAIAFQTALAQDTISITKGLVIGPEGRRGRSAIFADTIYYEWTRGTFKAPKAGASWGTDQRDSLRQWEPIQVNEEGIFEDFKLRGGYLYLTYDSPKTQKRVLDISGHGEVFVNDVPRGGDVYLKQWVLHPVTLKKGRNTFLIKGSRGKVKIGLLPVAKELSFTTRDMTLPDLITNENDSKIAAIRIINTASRYQRNLRIEATLNGKSTSYNIPDIMPMFTRKVPYSLWDNASEIGKVQVSLKLFQGKRLLDQTEVTYDVKDPKKNYKRTFISKIDGSVQYYGVREGNIPEGETPAMFLSVHGAGVKGIGQAGSYKNKDWGHVIAPTNRREFGFDWEDWGRWDAMEVQEIAEKRYNTDPYRTYLTGHSMGGHGSWQLGAVFPGKWAAIAPVAGWYSFFSYGGKRELTDPDPLQQVFIRASNSSNTLELSRNYLHLGIYILHGDADNNVPVTQARFMKKHLAEFHPDFAYYEEPDAGHWFGIDKKPIFDYFIWHTVKKNSEVDTLEFRTASPGVSAKSRFVTLYQQEIPYVFSGLKLDQTTLTRRERRKEPDKVLKNRSMGISTENLKMFKLDLAHCAGTDTLNITVDGKTFDGMDALGNHGEIWFGKEKGTWTIRPRPRNTYEKNPERYGNFKEAFNHNMIFVYGTEGNKMENTWAYNKARFDAETFYYRGNGSIDVIPDTAFDLKKYPDRSVILYGNASTNGAWRLLLQDSPIQVKRNEIRVGDKTLKGSHWGTYFIRPRNDSAQAAVGVVCGTGKEGFRAVTPNRYFVSGTGFPDFMLFSPEMMDTGFDGIKAAGYFGNDWSIENGDMQWGE